VVVGRSKWREGSHRRSKHAHFTGAVIRLSGGGAVAAASVGACRPCARSS